MFYTIAGYFLRMWTAKLHAFLRLRNFRKQQQQQRFRAAAAAVYLFSNARPAELPANQVPAFPAFLNSDSINHINVSKLNISSLSHKYSVQSIIKKKTQIPLFLYTFIYLYQHYSSAAAATREEQRARACIVQKEIFCESPAGAIT